VAVAIQNLQVFRVLEADTEVGLGARRLSTQPPSRRPPQPNRLPAARLHASDDRIASSTAVGLSSLAALDTLDPAAVFRPPVFAPAMIATVVDEVLARALLPPLAWSAWPAV